jgi:hypothetical protein
VHAGCPPVTIRKEVLLLSLRKENFHEVEMACLCNDKVVKSKLQQMVIINMNLKEKNNGR